jgi:lactoylglutathione lyase
MRFAYTIIYVADVEKTLTFYEKAFNLTRLFLHESGAYGELNTAATKLAFASETLAKSKGVDFISNRSEIKQAPGFEIGLVADDVEQAYQHAVKAGAIAIKEPAQKPWGQTVAYVRDINGILVEICSAI